LPSVWQRFHHYVEGVFMVQSRLVRTDSNKIARSQSTLSVTHSRKPSFVLPRESLWGILWFNAVLIDFPNDGDAMMAV
jgi:hypothetical protein